MTSSKIVPNTFQCFNDYVDRAMQHLTDAELRVLLFATRHILGWQDRISSRQATISLSRFEDGITVGHEDGTTTQMGGCGLGRAAISKAANSLCELGLLLKVGEASLDGQTWQLGSSPAWDKIEERSALQLVKNRQRTVKGATVLAEKRLAGSSDEPPKTDVAGSSDDMGTGSSHDTPPGSSDEHIQSQVQSQYQNQKEKESARESESVPSPAVISKTETPEPQPPSKESTDLRIVKNAEDQPVTTERVISPPPRKRFRVALAAITDADGIPRYADGAGIPRDMIKFTEACNDIFYGWVDGLKAAGRMPDADLDDLWSKHRSAVVGLAKHRRVGEQVGEFVRFTYSDENREDFIKKQLYPISPATVSNALGAWLEKQGSAASNAPAWQPAVIAPPSVSLSLTAAERAAMIEQGRQLRRELAQRMSSESLDKVS